MVRISTEATRPTLSQYPTTVLQQRRAAEHENGMEWNNYLQIPKTSVPPHVLEPDGKSTCLSAVHVSFQAGRPHLRLHARVKKKSAPAIIWASVCVFPE